MWHTEKEEKIPPDIDDRLKSATLYSKLHSVQNSHTAKSNDEVHFILQTTSV